jgi:thymidine phosphorylase
VGNALEVREAIATLAGRGPADVVEEVVELAAQMCLVGGVDSDPAAARRRSSEALESGRALDVFTRMVEAQGGDARVVDDPALLPAAANVTQVLAPRAGFVTAVDALAIGDASRALGAGRVVAGAAIDPSAGIVLHATRGDAVQQGAPLAELHHGPSVPLDECLARVASAFAIGDEPLPSAPVIKALMT